MDTPRLNFDAPPFAAGSHASWTGSHAVAETWTARQSAYLQLVSRAGALTDQEAAALLKWQVSSINSVRNAVKDQIVADGFEAFTCTDASGQARTTRRTRWTIRK